MRVGIATDHGGFGLKEELLGQLRAAGHEVVDFGAHRLSEGDDYPDYQVVKGLTSAEATNKEGGVIIMVAGVADGTGGNGFYNNLAQSKTAEEFLDRVSHVERRHT